MILILENTNNKIFDFFKNKAKRLTVNIKNFSFNLKKDRDYIYIDYSIDKKYIKSNEYYMPEYDIDTINEIISDINEFVSDYEGKIYFSVNDILNLLYTITKDIKIISSNLDSVYIQYNNKKIRISNHTGTTRMITGKYGDIDYFLYEGLYKKQELLNDIKKIFK